MYLRLDKRRGDVFNGINWLGGGGAKCNFRTWKIVILTNLGGK